MEINVLDLFKEGRNLYYIEPKNSICIQPNKKRKKKPFEKLKKNISIEIQAVEHRVEKSFITKNRCFQLDMLLPRGSGQWTLFMGCKIFYKWNLYI